MTQPPPQLQRFLSSIPIFGGLEEETLLRVAGMLDAQVWEAGEQICREGEPGRSMYVVGEGEVLVYRSLPDGSQLRMVRLGQGEFFGEMTLIDPQPRSASVVVERRAQLYALTIGNLYELYQQDMPGYVMVLQNICREMARRLRRADARICDLAQAADDDDRTQIRPVPAIRREAAGGEQPDPAPACPAARIR